MKRFLIVAVVALGAAMCAPVALALNVFATVPEWGALAMELGGDKVRVYVATNALQDPHRVEAKPSLIARARSADVVIATGAELEIGWLPIVLQQSGNGKVRPGQPGYFEAASVVSTIERPARLDRAEGDVHPLGNPHIQGDPRNIARVAAALAQRLAQIDPANAAFYEARFRAFDERWRAALTRWEKSAMPLRGIPVVVQHLDFSYLIAWTGLRQVATLEPKPGVEPSVAFLSDVSARLQREPAKMVLRAAYQSARASNWIAERTGMRVVVLPFTVGGDDQAKDLFTLYDDTLARLLKAAE